MYFHLLDIHGNITVLEQAFGAWAQGNAVNLSRSRIVQENGVMHLLAAAVPSLGIVGFKTYTVFRPGMRSAVDVVQYAGWAITLDNRGRFAWQDENRSNKWAGYQVPRTPRCISCRTHWSR